MSEIKPSDNLSPSTDGETNNSEKKRTAARVIGGRVVGAERRITTTRILTHEDIAREVAIGLGLEIHPNDDPSTEHNRSARIEAREPLAEKLIHLCGQIGISNYSEVNAILKTFVAEDKRAKIIESTGVKADRLQELISTIHSLIISGYELTE